jgi:RNA polymerase sigma-70 factor (ECF subfamily)
VGAVQRALVDGSPGLVFAPGGRLARVLTFKIVGDTIVEFEVIANPDRLKQLNLSVLDE